MNITSFLIVCPLVFLAGFIDAIGGGGGLISLPAYIFAGLPMHAAVATNKLSAATGTLISTTRLCRHAKIDFKLIIPAVFLAMTGATAGSRMSMLVDEKILKQMLILVLPVVAFFVLRKNAFAMEQTVKCSRIRTLVVSWMAAVLIGMYDGFYGLGNVIFSLDYVLPCSVSQAITWEQEWF